MTKPIKINFTDLKPLMEKDIKAGLVPALLGEAGIGKSSFLKDLANKLNTKVFVLSVNSLAGREDLTGARLVKDEDTKQYMQMFFPHQNVMEAILYARENPTETPILFLDEFNRTTPDVTSAVFQLITENRLGSEILPDNLRLVVAGNDVGNVNATDSAGVSRLVPYHVIPDLKNYIRVNPELNSFVKDFLQNHPDELVNVKKTELDEENSKDDSLFGTELDESFNQIATPRTWTGLSTILNMHSIDQSGSKKELKSLYSLVNNEAEGGTLLDVLIEAHIGNNSAKDGFSEMINAYIEKQTDLDVDDPQFATVDPFEDFDHTDDIHYIFQSYNNDPQNVTLMNDIALTETMTWLSKDENAKSFKIAELKTFLFAHLDELNKIQDNSLPQNHINALVNGIQNGEVTRDNPMFKLGSPVTDTPILKRINSIAPVLINDQLF